MRKRDRARTSTMGLPAYLWRTASRHVLPNGLTVLTIPAPGLHAASAAIYVRVGSRHETPETNGVSHFLEHLVFRGSVAYPDSAAISAAIEDVGGSLDGVTEQDRTYFHTILDPSGVATAIDVLGDLVARPLLREMDVEREIIFEELLDEVDSRGRDVDSDNLIQRLAFGEHPLGFPVAGTPTTLRAIGEKELRAHHGRFYVGENVILVAAGPVDEAEVLDLAQKHLGALPRGEPSAPRPAPAWPLGPQLQVVQHEDAQAEFTLAFPCPPESHTDHPALACLHRLLDDGLGARLQREVVERRGLVYAVDADVDSYADTGLFTIDGACAPAKIVPVTRAILDVLEELAEVPPPEEELLRVQRRHRMHLSFALDSAADLVGWHGSAAVLGTAEGFEERCRRIERVTPADVQRVASETFARKNLLAVVVGPVDRRARRELELLLGRRTS